MSKHVVTVLLALAAAPAFGDPAKGSEMVKIPGGDFMMGCDNRGEACHPTHKVTVASFELDKNLITTKDYQACVDAKACAAPDLTRFKRTAVGKKMLHLCNFGQQGKDKHPMNCLSFDNAKAYCAWAGKRLPSEEEWELAARGTKATTYPWGNDDATEGKRACWGARAKTEEMGEDTKGTCEVGSFPDGNTPQGVQDMAGNVEEWTSSTWTSDYEQRGHANDLSGTVAHVYRGGSWWSKYPSDLASVHRAWHSDNEVLVYTGARCAR